MILMEIYGSNLISGKHVLLRDPQPADVDAFIHMQSNGEWRQFDAPWEGFRTSFSNEEERRYRVQFQEDLHKEKPVPRKFAVIATLTGEPIGSVNRYIHSNAWIVGISIWPDDCLNKGLGSEALKLWIDYLFSQSDIYRLGLDTWSFNPRMIHVAEKMGFIHEGTQRGMQFWQDKWLDLVHFGMLRTEWENLILSSSQNQLVNAIEDQRR